MTDDLLPSSFAEVDRHSGDVFDYGDPPPDVRCDCGEHHPWVWWEPGEKYAHMRLRAKYMHPKVNPCPKCKPVLDADAFWELEQRQRNAQIPMRYRRFRLERHRVQGSAVALEDFRDDIRRHNSANPGRPLVGVDLSGAKAYGAVSTWEPSHGSMLLHGPPGTGKTLLLCALATKLLEVPPSREVDMLEAGRIEAPKTQQGLEYMLSRGLHMCTVRAPMASSVLYVTTEDLADREALRWRNDPKPSSEVAEASVLLLDELWPERAPNAAEVKGVKRIIDYRYRHGLPTVMASNAPPEELLDYRNCPYGARMADRFAELLQGSLYAMGGTSWRR